MSPATLFQIKFYWRAVAEQHCIISPAQHSEAATRVHESLLPGLPSSSRPRGAPNRVPWAVQVLVIFLFNAHASVPIPRFLPPSPFLLGVHNGGEGVKKREPSRTVGGTVH